MAQQEKSNTFTILSGDTEKFITIEITVTGHLDRNYGADADGNRGVPVWFIEDHDYTVPTLCDDGTTLTQADLEQLEEEVGNWVNNTDWDFDEAYQDAAEEDYDKLADRWC